MENQNNTPLSAEVAPVIAAPQNTGMGPVMGIIIIVLVLAMGGVYVWSTKATLSPTVQGDQAVRQNSTAQPEDAKTHALMQTSSSDSASAIEAGLSATDTGNSSEELQLQ